MLSSAAYLNAAFPSPAPSVAVTPEQRAALVALNNAAYAAARALGRSHPFEVHTRMMARVSDDLVDRAAVNQTVGD